MTCARCAPPASTPSWSAKPSCARPSRARRSKPCSAPETMARGKAQADLPWAELEPRAQQRRLLEWAPHAWPLAEGWRAVVEEFLASPDGQRLGQFLRERLEAGALIYPPH